QDIFARGDIRAYWDAGPHERPEAQPYPMLSEELKAHLVERPYLLLFGPFSTRPPLFRRQETGPTAGRYYLMQGGGGPSISLSLAEQLPGRLAVGMLVTQPT